MKSCCILGILLLVLLTWPTPLWAASYIDEMDKLVNDGAKRYENLEVVETQSIPLYQGLPDMTFATFAQMGQLSGSVTYQVGNAERIEVAIYTQLGTYVRPSSVLGEPPTMGSSAGPNRPTGADHARFSPSADRIITLVGGTPLQMVYGTNYSYLFDDFGAGVPGDLVDYGINVYAYSASGSATRLTLENTGSTLYNSTRCYEEFTAPIPSGTRQVKVEINDISVVPMQAGGSMVKGRLSLTNLASVALYGEGLYLGQPAEVSSDSQEETGDSQEESGESSDEGSGSSYPLDASSQSSGKFEGSITSGSSRSSSSSRAATAYATSAGRSSSSSATASSSSPSRPGSSTAGGGKFTGTAAGGGTGGTGSTSQAHRATGVQEEGSSSGTATVMETAAQSLVYRVLGEDADEDGAFTLLISAYIVVVCGVILFVLLRRKGASTPPDEEK